jgi:hypothetical protein
LEKRTIGAAVGVPAKVPADSRDKGDEDILKHARIIIFEICLAHSAADGLHMALRSDRRL